MYSCICHIHTILPVNTVNYGGKPTINPDIIRAYVGSLNTVSIYRCVAFFDYYCTLQSDFVKQLFNISNEAAIDPAKSVLMIELGEKYCYLIILKKEDGEAERLVYYESDEEESLLPEILAAHEEFNRHYADVLINYSFPQSIMTPSKYYNLEDGKKMLQLIYGESQDVTVLSEHLVEWQLYNVYEVPKPVHSWISMQFHSGKYWHNYSSSLKNFSGDAGDDLFLVDFKTHQFSIIVVKSRQLQLTQTFAYTEPADVIYYLLKIGKQFSISQKEVKLVLSGLIEEKSALYQELYNYFVKISFAATPDFIKQLRSFEEYPAHFFSSLYNLAPCVS